MGIVRTITCDICGLTEQEPTMGEGWQGWGKLDGVVDDKRPVGSIALCPDDLAPVVAMLEKRRKT